MNFDQNTPEFINSHIFKISKLPLALNHLPSALNTSLSQPTPCLSTNPPSQTHFHLLFLLGFHFRFHTHSQSHPQSQSPISSTQLQWVTRTASCDNLSTLTLYTLTITTTPPLHLDDNTHKTTNSLQLIRRLNFSNYIDFYSDLCELVNNLYSLILFLLRFQKILVNSFNMNLIMIPPHFLFIISIISF